MMILVKLDALLLKKMIIAKKILLLSEQKDFFSGRKNVLNVFYYC